MTTIRSLTIASVLVLGGASSVYAVDPPIAHQGGEGNEFIISGQPGRTLIATYLGSLSSNFNTVYFGETALFNNQDAAIGDTVELGVFDNGSKLMFSMTSYNAGSGLSNIWYSGGVGGANNSAGSMNADGLAHARIESGYNVNDLGPGAALVSFDEAYGSPTNFADFSFSLTYSTATAPVPEASTLLLSLAGLGLMGAYLRRQRTSTTAAI
jgi:hypothetical protein